MGVGGAIIVPVANHWSICMNIDVYLFEMIPEMLQISKLASLKIIEMKSQQDWMLLEVFHNKISVCVQVIRKKRKWFGKGVLFVIIFYALFFKLKFLYAFYYYRRKINKTKFCLNFFRKVVLKVFFHLWHNVQEWLSRAPDYATFP